MKYHFQMFLRVDHVYKPKLSFDLIKVKTLELNPYDQYNGSRISRSNCWKTQSCCLTDIDLKEIGEKFRFQSIVFRIASSIYNSEKKTRLER